MPTGTSNEDFVNLGTNVFKSARMLPNTKKIRIKWLNYYNNGTAKSVWVANTKVVEIPADSTAKTVRQNGVYNGVTINTQHGMSVSRDDGKVTTMLNATEGITIGKRDSSNSAWESKVFEVDTNGNLVTNNMMANNIAINGGSINWQSVPKPSYTAADIRAISSTYIDQNGIWTGSINANSITTGKLDVDRITLKGLDIKNNSGNTTFAIDSSENVTLGGSITWGDKPSYSYSDLGGSKPPTDADNTRDWVTAKGMIYDAVNDRLTIRADDIQGGEFTATEYIQIGKKDSANKELAMYTSSGYNVRFTAFGKEFPKLYISASEVIVGDRLYVGNRFTHHKVLATNDTITAVFE